MQWMRIINHSRLTQCDRTLPQSHMLSTQLISGPFTAKVASLLCMQDELKPIKANEKPTKTFITVHVRHGVHAESAVSGQ